MAPKPSAAAGLSPKLSKADREILILAKQRFEQEGEATQKIRQEELKDLAFFSGDQWDVATRNAREAQQANIQNGLPPVPARPCLTINKVREPVRQVLNQERDADLGVTVVAADDFEGLTPPVDDTEIKLREGLLRRIQRAPEAADARTWAFSRAVIAGRGFYCVMTRYLPGKTWYQEPYVHRIFNQSSVSLDPAHEQPDGSDADWGFLGNDVPWTQYEHDYPRVANGDPNPLFTASESEFRQLGADMPMWFSGEKDLKSVRVVDYWYVEREGRTLLQLADGTALWKDEAPDTLDLTDKTQVIDSREVVEKRIKWCKLDGYQILEKTDWLGPDLPIVKVLGEELHPYDNERRTEGMIRSAKDAQVGFNAMVSKWVESVGLAPIPPFQATPDQIAGFEQWYQVANTRTLPYLPYNSTSEAGQPVGPPTRTPVDTPISAIAASVAMFDEAIQSTTGVPEARVGRNTDSHLKSGTALRQLRESSEQGTSNFLDNLRRSMRYEGQILNNLLFPLYGQPGRLVRIVNGEGAEEVVRVTVPGQMAQNAQPLQNGAPPKDLTLTKDARFNVAIKITRAFDTRRQEEVAMLAELLAASPVLMTWFGDLFFKHQDGPGHDVMAERAKVMLDPRILAAMSENTNLPPEVAARVKAMEGQIQHAEQAMQQLNSELADAKRGDAAKIKVAEIEADTKKFLAEREFDRELELQRMKDATAIDVANISAVAKGAVADKSAELEQIALGHEAEQADRDRLHEGMVAESDHRRAMETGVHDTMASAALADQGHQQNLEAGEQGHGQAMEQAEQAAALTPPEPPVEESLE